MDCSIGFLLPAVFFFLPVFSSCRFFLPASFLLPAVFPSSVPEGGELPITAGGMTVGHVTCGFAVALSPSSPKGANRIPSFSCSPPSGTVVCVVFCFPQVPFPPVIPPAVIGSSPPSGTVVGVVFCYPQVPFPPVIPPAVIGSSPPSGTVVGVVFYFPQVPFPSVIPPAVIESSPPSGTSETDVMNQSFRK